MSELPSYDDLLHELGDENRILRKKLKDNCKTIDNIKKLGGCQIDNATNGGLCIGKNCNRDWCLCSHRKIVSLDKYLLDCPDDIQRS